MTKRAITARQRAWLLDELSLWRRNAIVSEQQAERIADLYEGAGEMAERGRSRAVSVLMAAAATLVGLAALLLIGYNWDQLDRLTKLGMVLGVIVATHALGFHLRYQRNNPGLANKVFFLGCLFYGAGIWLVAQVFHIQSHYPDGVWWWAIGALPFALALETRALHALVVALLGLWAGMEVLEFGHLGAWLFGRWDGLPNGAYSLPLLALPGIVWAYRKQSAQILTLYVMLLTWWTFLQPFAWHLDTNPVYFVGAVGALLLVIAECHAPGSRFAIPYRYYGSLLVGGVLVPLSFYKFNRHLMPEWRGLVLPPLVLAAVALAIVLLTRRTGRGSAGSVASGSGFGAAAGRLMIPLGISFLMVLLPAIASAGRSPTAAESAALLPTVLVNIAMLAGSFWLMQVGLREDRGRPFGAGVIYFLLWAVLRYVDLFGDFGGMLGAAMMFFMCGGALYGVARYWQGRKEVRYA